MPSLHHHFGSVILHVHGRTMEAGVELGRMGRARHSLYMVISSALSSVGARYTLPPYQGMAENLVQLGDLMQAAGRPRGEGAAFMPAFMQRSGLHL